MIAIEDIKAGTTSYPLHKTIDGDVKTLDGTDTTLEEHRIIGKRYTLEISNLEQEVVGVGDEYLDYSGVITVAIKEGTAKDTTANENTATTLTSGVNIPGGTGTGTIVDVVDPLWEVAGTATAKPVNQTASIPIKGTDKYLKTIGLTASDITVEVNGVAKTSTDGVTVSVVEDTSTTLAYGKQYRVTVNGYERDAYQVKITLREGLMVDNSGNRSKETSFILFSSLKETSTETDATSPFIGNTNIQRQKIEKIIFKDNLDGINDTRWDVSQLQDGSIWGWYTTDATTGNYTVYIGSYIIVNGNVNSSYLFSHIGYDSSCKVTGNTGATDGTEKPLIENIELLHVDSVTNMSYMFNSFGFSTMKSFDLGDAFDTGAVTNMCLMFNDCGRKMMESIDLGEQFDTSNVTLMISMFQSCGNNAMTSLDLGDKFDTKNVINMVAMFNDCGLKSMTGINLGDKFDTSNVTNMYHMFRNCGATSMTSLDLGDLFYTTSVTDMTSMFQGCGSNAMVALDLGPNFTKIADSNTDFMTDCGTTGAVIYAPEAIYKDLTSFKLNSGDTSTATGAIACSEGRTINPIYKPEWEKVSSSLDKTTNPENPTLSVVVKANASKTQTINGVNINYNSDVTSALTPSNVYVYIDGELDGDTNKNGVLDEGETPSITKAVTSASPSATSAEITHTITLSNFEETLRQSGKNFKEWSGNIAIKIGGRGEATSTYTANVLKDVYGNQNMMETDATGSWIDVKFKDEDTDHNTDGTMFEDFIKPEFTYEYLNTIIDHDTKTVTVVFDVTDKYFNESALTTDTTASNIDITFDGTTPTNATKTLTKIDDLTATVNGTSKKVGERYQLVLTNLDQGGGGDYSGVMTLAFPANIITDKSGNANVAKTITVGIDDPTTGDGDDSAVIVDVVDPIWKVENINIDETNKKVTADLIATDKYLTGVQNSTLTTNDITVSVDGDVNANTTINKALTEPTFSTNETTGLKEIKYILTLDNFEEAARQSGKSFLEYSGNVKIKIAAGTVTDDASMPVSPSALFDAEGTNPDGLHIGDFVNYDAGIWTQEEIDSIGTGVVGNLSWANGSEDSPNEAYQFGGFTAGTSRNGNAKSLTDNFLRDSTTGTSVTGWRIFDIQNNEVKLISAGTPEEYCTPMEDGADVITECVLIGSNGAKYRMRDYNMYVNTEQKATRAETFRLTILSNWFKKYINNSGSSITNDSEIKKIYDEQYVKYQNLIDNNSYYTLAESCGHDSFIETFSQISRTIMGGSFYNTGGVYGNQAGVRILVTLSSDVLFNSQKTGTKTLTGGNMDTYGGDQTYNCWKIAEGSATNNTDPITRTDGHSNTSKEQEFELGYVDFIKPEFTYEYLNTIIDHDTKTVTVVFDVTDKYFNESALTTDTTASNIDITFDGTTPTNATKTLTKIDDLTATVNGTSKKVGERYQLVLTNLDQGGGGDYSGVMTLAFPTNIITDESGNANVAKTITVGIDEPTTGDGDDTAVIVDVVDPIWKVENINIDETNKKVTADLIATDKYLTGVENSTLTINDITVSVDGDVNANTAITKALTEPTFSTNETTGLKEIKYTLTLDNFEEAARQSGKSFLEYSGTVKIKIAAGTVTDDATGASVSPSTLFDADGTNTDGLHIGDFVNYDAGTWTQEEIDSIQTGLQTNLQIANGSTSLPSNAFQFGGFTAGSSRNGNATPYISSYNYIKDETGNAVTGWRVYDIEGDTVTLISAGNPEDYYHSYDFDYGYISEYILTGNVNTSWSGAETSKYQKRNWSNYVNAGQKAISATVLTKSRLDSWYSKYTDAGSGANTYTNSTFQKIYSEPYIKYQSIIDNYSFYGLYTAFQSYSVYRFAPGDRKLDPLNYVVDDYGGNEMGVRVLVSLRPDVKFSAGRIGTKTISGGNMATYGGEQTYNCWAIVEGTTTDGHSNTSKEQEFELGHVDFIKPEIEKISFTKDETAQTETIVFTATDKYLYPTDPITMEDIKILVDGVETTELTGNLTNTEITDSTRENVVVGHTYTLVLSDFEKIKNANQIKVLLPAGTITDRSGNGNEAVEWIVYNVLKPVWPDDSITVRVGNATTASIESNSPFLGNSTIQRQNIENVTFVSNIPETVFNETTGAYVDSTAWDVSARQDKSIIAWYETQASGALKVYIGSNYEIFANQDSRHLFAYIGYAGICTATETITNIDLLNVSSATNMSYMFFNCGYTAMTSLDLGDKFNTSNVTGMHGMFKNCGYTAMTSLDLGDKFDTSNVTGMGYMFTGCGYTAMTSLDLGDKFDTSNVTNDMAAMFTVCGYTAMTSLDLGDKFDTSNVTNMYNMFAGCGYTAMTSLDLGDKFDTSNVTDMSDMFNECGYTAMTSLDLGDKFDTSNVTNMKEMFSSCGYKAMTSLELGDLFYTTSATNMESMFEKCGYTAMTTLDLGPKFTKIADQNEGFMTNCGKSGAIVYAPEAIYKDLTHFKLSTDSTTAIEYTEGVYQDSNWTVTGTRGTINPIYKPEWTKVSSAIDETNETLSVTVKGNASKTQAIGGVNINYNSNVTSTLSPEDITVYINGVQDGDRNGNGVIDEGETPSIQVAISSASPSASNQAEITHTITLSNLEEATRQLDADGNIKKFSEWSGNISIKIGGRGEDTSTYTANVLTDEYGNQNMMETDETGSWIDVLYKDADTDHNTNGTMFTDFIEPEFTYEYSETTIDYTGKTLTTIFYVADKYFDNANSSLALSDLDIRVDGEQIVSDDGTNTFTEEAYNDADGNRIGTKYTLVIKNLPRTTGDPYNDYSGPVSITIPANKIADLSGNKNLAKTITIGIDDPENDPNHNTEQIVDVVDPIWKLNGDIEKTVNPTTGEISVSMDIYGTDKYYKQDTLTAEQIQLWVDGINITAEGSTTEVTRTLTKVEDLKETRTVNGVQQQVTYGVHYKLTLSGIKETDESFFAERAKYNTNPATGRPYREYSGTMRLVIPANTIEDNYGNKNPEYPIELEHIDTLRPEVIQVSSETNVDATNIENSTQTIVFDVVDKYLDTSAISTTDTSKIHVLIDGEEVESITKPSTAEEQANNSGKIFKEIVNIETLTDNIGGNGNHLVGYRYTLKLSNFKNPRTSAVYGEYTTWSGNLSIKVDADTALDTNGTGNLETELTGDEQDTTKEYVDFIKPDVTYKYGASSQAFPGDIDYQGKTFKMVFEITDKNFANSTLTIDDLDILIDGEEPTWKNATASADTVGVVKDLTSTEIRKTVNGVADTLIGYRYTLTLSNLEQLQIKENGQYLDYSGVITVAIPQGVATDKGPKGTSTNPNENDAVTITSGIDIPGGTIPDDSQVVDVVDPLWEKVSSSAYAFDPTDKTTSTATITVKGTDKYYDSSSLTADKVKVFVNGTEVTDGSVTVTVDSTVTEVNSSSGTRIGDQYTLTIKGWAQDAHQMKIQIQPGAMTDKSGNTNKATDLIVYNTLISAATETSETSAFLGNSTIQRQNIENVTFVSNLPETVYNTITGQYVDSTAWDVSARQDKSIIAWYETQASGALKVYIGSNDEIFANQDAGSLFSYIGYADICTATETITNINLLNVSSATDMSYMFANCGYRAMTNLNLGDKFDTSNVTNMGHMFNHCGYTAMTSLNLGDKFDTSNVTDMQSMFTSCGESEMTSLDLGDKFDTSSATDMSYMFANCGYRAMTSLNLGDKFDTSNVTNMSGMFRDCGYTAMTSLDLGNKFDTSKVTDMNDMFRECGYTAMTSLDLGDLFYTTSATDMSNMFNGCGNTAMTSLDLGPAFTKIADANTNFMTNCGKSGAIIYAPESIYNDITHLKLSTDSTTTIEYTEKDADGNATGTRGTINPIYKPEWTKVSSTIDETNKTLSVTIKGNASLEPQTINGVNIKYNSKVTSTLAGDLINVYIDGELDGDTNKNGILDEGETTSITRTVIKDTTNSTDTEIYYTITLSNFEEALRQSGKNFKEWSGNISIQPLKGTLKDAYGSHTTTDADGNTVVVKGDPGNGNMQEIDLTQGTWTKIELQDTATDHNTDGTMFTDYIKPEFTYEYSNVDIDTDANTVIDYENKTVTVVFDVTDKYFKQANITADNVTITVGGIEPDWTKSTKTLTKKTLAEDKVVGDITYKANGDIYYTVNGTPTKIGERYQLVVTNLETENGIGYSGAMTMSFPAGVITDQSNNSSLAKTITVGIDDPENHEEHQDAKIVDVVNPLWTGPHNVNSIDRTNKTVDVKILGSDKYYATDVFAEAIANGTINATLSKIKVYVDDVEQTSITKTLTQITDNTELQTLAQTADLQSANIEDVKVGYTLTLGNFENISGVTKIVIEPGTITDQSGNVNIETTIPVGNINWVENNEPLQETDENYPRYSAFRNDIVDFIKPVIKYQYSAVEGTENPNIDYQAKTLTVKFTVTDKYLVESSIMNADGTLNTNNVRLQISTLNDSGVEEFRDITDSGITTSITSTPITDGYEYTLVVQNFELVYNNEGQYMDYSGIVQLVFAEGQIDDTSGNKNAATTITIDTDDGDDPDSGVIVDVIDPIIEKTADNLSIVNVNNGISRDIQNETGTVSIRIKATDKYLSTGTLQNAENVEKIKVKIVKPNGETIYPDTITKSVSQISKQSTSIIYGITLGNFEANQGVTSIIIPEGVIKDSSGNGNRETEILVGNSTWTEIGDTNGEYTAFRDSIVDFIRPTWEYSTSSITRDRDGETGTVTVKILGRDNYYLKDTLTENKIFVYVANSETPDSPITTITKSLTKITDQADLDGADTGYYLTLGNFQNYDGRVKIEIADNTIKDTSGNGNKITELDVGNPEWVENDIGDSTTAPKYTAFRNSIVDFIKPTIKYQYTADVNPLIDQENKQVAITFDAVDTNFLESVITVDDIQILVDDMDVTNVLSKTLTNADITDGSGNGLRYTLTLSNFELENILDGETFKRHSGKIELVIAAGTTRDTSGNENRETRLIVDNDNGDDAENYVIVDFIKPKIYYVDKFISWDKRYADVTIAGTDRFYDFNTKISPEDITIYQQNLDGDYVQVTDLPITITSVRTQYGYNFVVRLSNFEEEYRLKISVPAGVISDTQGHYNDATDIFVDLDNKKPVWKYISTNTSEFETGGKISFDVKGQDKFLDLANSGLADGDVSIYRDGTDITDTVGITISDQGQSDTEKSKSYKIDVTGLTEIGTYSLVIKEKTLIDEFDNESATTTITFSKSAITTNTDNYQTVTYHASPDFEQTHQAYVHELMSVNTTGTNFENTTFRPSTIGEIYDDGKNTLFAEPFKYQAGENGASGVQTAYSFKGWGLANEKGFIEDEANATIYGLYSEIPETAKASDGMVHLKAIWQQATVIFVSDGDGDNANDGLSPTTPVKDLETAYSKISSSGTTSTNIIVIMDQVEWNSSNKLTGNATITSLYAGVDYKAQSAELKISSNMEVNGDIEFDNIKLYSNSTSVSDGSDYVANGSYTNMLITNYGDVILGRRILTPEGKYTFGAVIGGNYKTETTVGEIGAHSVIVEAGKYNDIIVGSSLTTRGQTTTVKYVSHHVLIGNMKDAAISRNDKLTITGYLSMGELEDRYYPYSTSGSQDTANAYSRTYAITEIYSGTFTGENKFAKESEDASVYLRAMNGFTEGKVQLDMYGGNITGNLYAGARMATSHSDQETNILNFYGGSLTGNMFGHGAKDASTGGSNITLEGMFNITGNIFGGSNATSLDQGKVTGNTSILVNSSSITVNGNIYGGGYGLIDGTSININNGVITGNTNIELSAGTVNGDIYGGGYNCGATGLANITINNGTVLGSIYGGAYQNQVRTDSSINILGGTVNAIYGGNVLTVQSQLNNDSIRQNTNITINSSTATVNGPIYGGGKFDSVGTAEIYLKACANTPTVYGGSDGDGITNITNIYLQGMTVDTIYGGLNGNGTVSESNIYLQSGTATDVYGGGYGGTTTTSNINLGVEETGEATITNIYGGSNTTGTVSTSNVILKSGTVTNVFGGGNSAGVDTANVTLDGITIDTIYGGSKNAGNTTNTNVVLTSGTVTNVYGGGYDVGVTNAKVTQKGATVTNIYGGNQGGTGDGGETTNSTVNVDSAVANNIYGGNKDKGTTKYATINIRGASTITGKLYGGGYKSDIAKTGNTGKTTINISGGTINKDVNGGSEDSVVYGETNINIGKDAVTDDSPVAGNINIKGQIYGAGSSATNTDYSYISVYGNTHVTMDNSEESPITFSGSIYGAGKQTNYSTNNTSSDGSTVRIKDFGTSTTAHQMASVQRTGKLYIGNSYLELLGVQDVNNYYKKTSYTLNRITNGLALHDNTTLYTKRGFNMVGGFESFKTNSDNTTEKQTVEISGNTVTRNVDNRIYTLEGINLIFAKEEGELSDRSNEDIWGDVNGMAFFGMYRPSRQTGRKEYDIYAPNYSGGAVKAFFANGTYIEGRHKANHDIATDGFYTNVADYSDESNIIVTPQVIDVTDYGTYYDWIIGEDVVNYNTSLIASTYSTWSMAELLLDYKYQQGATYTVNRVSSNALDTDINLINPLEVPTYSANSNNTFGLTMETDKSGWLKGGVTNMYTDGNGSFDGDSAYGTDNSNTPGTIIFKLFNSINVTENRDLGNVNIVLTGKTRTGEDASQGNTFKIVIAVNLQSVHEEDKEQYTPRFTDSTNTQLNYTTDSSVDITYVLYKQGLTESIYTSGDYRVLSSTVQLPAGTRITMRDYGQGDNVNKVYYYQVASNTSYDSTEIVDGTTRYLYKLSNFIDMGGSLDSGSGTVAKYSDDNSSYYHSSGVDGNGYALEKYDISINLMDSGIDANQLAQETYLELRSSSGVLKYDNGDKDLTYNLYNQNAVMTQSISNEGQSYSVFENLTIPYTFDATLLEQSVDGANIRDTKYYDKSVGLAIEIVNEVGERVKAPDVQNLKLTNTNDSTQVYTAGDDGVIRVPLSDGLATIKNSYTLSLSQYSVPAGTYIVKSYVFASDDGLHYGNETTVEKEFYITFINRLLGLAGVESTNNSRIISKSTGLNLDGNNGLDLTVKVGSPTDDTNIRVELYKRNPTYTVTEDESGNRQETYNGTQYTKVDLSQYLEGTWETPESQGLVTPDGCTEYMVMPKETYDTVVDLKTVAFAKAIRDGISTGEYKLVFKAYYDNTLIQTVRKTFIVTQ